MLRNKPMQMLIRRGTHSVCMPPKMPVNLTIQQPHFWQCSQYLHRTVCEYASTPDESLDAMRSKTDSDVEENILSSVNNLTAHQLRHEKHLPYTISEEICKHRGLHGPFKSIDELKNVKKVGPKTFRSICEKFKTKAPEGLPVKIKKEDDPLQKFVSPVISPSVFQSLSNVTSLEVCSDGVYFSSMTRDSHLTDWNQIPLRGSNDLRQTPSQILEQAFHVVENLPESSIYIMENRPMRKISQTHVYLILMIGRLQMAIQTLLNKDFPTVGYHKVYQIKSGFVLKSFDLCVGGERVSGQHIIKQIQDGQYPGKFQALQEEWWHYNQLKSEIVKERYANALLVNIAFCQNLPLIRIEDSDS